MTTNGATSNGAMTNSAQPNGTGVLMELCLPITDQRLYEELNGYHEGEDRFRFATSALKIGVIALQQAQGRIDADRVRQEGDRFIENMGHTLAEHQREVTGKIENFLKDYFDPDSGRFNERVKALIGQGGELEQAIRKEVEGSDSSLAQTLAAHVGQDSRLMQILNPESANSLITQLTQSTESTLTAQRERILSEFSLDNGEGSLSRLVAELKSNHGDVGKALEERIDKVTGEFSLDKDDSALSRLMRGVETAQRQISSEFDLNQDGSALAQMQKRLLDVIESQRKSNEEFQRDVIERLASMTARRQEAQRGTQHGSVFEDDVFDFIEEWSQKSGDAVTRTSDTLGIIRNSKVGDAVIELGTDNVAAGSRIVVEAKQNQSYTFSKALSELKEARENREAGVGLFVFSARTVKNTVEPFSRNGNDIVVVWNAEDPASDVVLNAGLSVAKALSVRTKVHSGKVGADFIAIENAIRGIESYAGDLNQITTWATTIRNNGRNNGDNILKRVEKIRGYLAEHIAVLNEKVGGLREAVGSNE